jgi:CO/xanthine dehydrogenase Mo-binding subunit
LPPVAADERPKGMGEGGIISVVPALLNAIHDATGHRFQSLPVTRSMIKGILT